MPDPSRFARLSPASECHLSGDSLAALELGSDLVGAHTVEVFGHHDLSVQKTDSAHGTGPRRFYRNDLDHRLASPRDDERFPIGRSINQTRKFPLGFLSF